jgi:hypothetical protein
VAVAQSATPTVGQVSTDAWVAPAARPAVGSTRAARAARAVRAISPATTAQGKGATVRARALVVEEPQEGPSRFARCRDVDNERGSSLARYKRGGTTPVWPWYLPLRSR